jgi:hypothetical protein
MDPDEPVAGIKRSWSGCPRAFGALFNDMDVV